MEAFRIIKKPSRRKITITLPKSFSDSPVEIIILPVGEIQESSKVFNPEEYYGIGKSALSIDEIDRKLHKMRDEWERDI